VPLARKRVIYLALELDRSFEELRLSSNQTVERHGPDSVSRSLPVILDWLEQEKIVTSLERKGLRIGLNMRNTLSHVEHSSTDTPSSDKLRFTARLINTLFHRLP
jgi:hypothetical protein